MTPRLFTPIEIGSVTVPNRISVPPMCMYSAKLGVAQPFHFAHYAKLAQSGAGLVCIEACAVTPEGRITENDLGLWSDECEAGIAAIVRTMRQAMPGVRIFIQLSHAGRKASRRAPWAGSTVLAVSDGGWRVRAPSDLPFGGDGPKPLPLDFEECGELARAFGKAAARAVRAGVDGIELHMAHGYLIHEFLSPLSNRRIDEYGGAFENRTRFAVDVMEAVMSAVGRDAAVGLRVSATDWVDGGWTPEETVDLVKLAKRHGLVFADVSTGGLVPDAAIDEAPGYQVPFAAQVKRAAGMPVFACGRITNASQAETILRAAAADVIDVGRGVLDDPNWGWHAARALRVKSVPELAVPQQYERGIRL